MTRTRALRRDLRLIAGLATVFLLVWLLPTPVSLRGVAHYLPIHTALETFAIVVAMLVFAVTWNTYRRDRPDSVVILAGAMLAVGLIDFAHMLSYRGMPDFVTAGSTEKAINFWLAARLLAALALLGVAVAPKALRFAPRSRHLLLAAGLALTAVVYWIGLFHAQAIPRTFIEGQGLTPLKIVAEWLIIAVLAVPALIFFRRAQHGEDATVASLFAAAAISILSEMCFTLYKEVNDLFNLLGHAYKVVAYLFIYRAIFVETVRQPVERLSAAQARLVQNEEKLRQLNAGLEARVAARTVELERANAAIATKEEEVRSVLESLADCVVSIDEDGIVHSVNHAVEKVLGYGVAEVVGHNVSMLMAEPHRSAHDGYIKRYCRTGEAHVISGVRQVEAVHKDGTRIVMELAISEYFVGGKRYFTGILHDVRERVRIMADLERSRLDAEQANRAKSAFLATMSHEIRTPMNGVVGMIDVLQQSSLRPAQSEMVNTIRDSAFSLLAIIDDILDFSKIEAGKLELEQAPMCIAAVVEGCAGTLDRLAGQKGVELTLFTDPAIPDEVRGDAMRLRQVLLNLLGNAIKFSGGRQVTGRVALRAVLAAGDADRAVVEFRIADNGIGMDAATRAQLFTPFTQADASTTRRFGGTGLGLSISLRLVELMGGEIAVHSEPGEGSVFTLRLPFAALPASAADAAAAPLAGLDCLVVGAATGLADDLEAYLAHAGAAVARAPDLADARVWIDHRPPGVCIAVIDTAGGSPPIEELRGAARARPGVDARLVLIGRGGRRQCRSEAPDLVTLDGEAMPRRAFLLAVAIAAGRAKEAEWEGFADEVVTAPAPVSRDEARRQGRLILVAEDNPTNQKVIGQQLALLGLAAGIVDDGRAALECWRSGDYGILLTDLHMPEMDGYQLTATIRAGESGKPRAPIIAFTANALKGEAERCRAAGMDDYISKPVQLAQLKAVLEKWLPAAGEIPPDGPAPPAVTTVGQSPIDVRVLATVVGDNREVIREFLADFRASTAMIVAELRVAFAAGRAAAAAAAAHKLKSSSFAVGALALGALCGEIERAGAAGDTETLAVLWPGFEAELSAVERQLALSLAQTGSHPQ